MDAETSWGEVVTALVVIVIIMFLLLTSEYEATAP
jgi:hypothetical protein